MQYNVRHKIWPLMNYTDISHLIWTILSSRVRAFMFEYSDKGYLFTWFLNTKTAYFNLSSVKSSWQILHVLARVSIRSHLKPKGNREKDLTYSMCVLKWATVNIFLAFWFEEAMLQRILINYLPNTFEFKRDFD